MSKAAIQALQPQVDSGKMQWIECWPCKGTGVQQQCRCGPCAGIGMRIAPVKEIAE